MPRKNIPKNRFKYFIKTEVKHLTQRHLLQCLLGLIKVISDLVKKVKTKVYYYTLVFEEI